MIAQQFEKRMDERERKRNATKTMLAPQPDQQVIVSASGHVKVLNVDNY